MGKGWGGQDPCSLCNGMCAYTDGGSMDIPTGKSGVSQRERGLVDAPLGRVVLAREGGGGGAWWMLLWEEWC